MPNIIVGLQVDAVDEAADVGIVGRVAEKRRYPSSGLKGTRCRNMRSRWPGPSNGWGPGAEWGGVFMLKPPKVKN